MSEQKEYWTNKMATFTGITLKECEEEYNRISMMPDRFIVASNLHQQTAQGSTTGKYDLAIFVKIRPNQSNLSQQSSGVPSQPQGTPNKGGLSL